MANTLELLDYFMICSQPQFADLTAAQLRDAEVQAGGTSLLWDWFVALIVKSSGLPEAAAWQITGLDLAGIAGRLHDLTTGAVMKGKLKLEDDVGR